MKILNWFKSKTKYQNSIESICGKYGIENYTINEDGTVDVNGNVELHNMRLNKLPLKFGKVTGYFSCSDNKLTSLEGGPKWVGDSFYCYKNQLTTLEGGPEYVGGKFFCDYIDNEYVTIHEVYCLLDHKSFIKQYNRDKKLKGLLND